MDPTADDKEGTTVIVKYKGQKAAWMESFVV